MIDDRHVGLRRRLNRQVTAEEIPLEAMIRELMVRNGLGREQVFSMVQAEAEGLMDAEEAVVEVGHTAYSRLLELAAKRLLVRARMGTILGEG